jgi:hypothetical protein
VENFQFVGGRDDIAAPVSNDAGQQKTFADPDQKPAAAPAPAGKQLRGEKSSKAGARQAAVKDDEGFTDADIPF